jgi:hypothetical protein
MAHRLRKCRVSYARRVYSNYDWDASILPEVLRGFPQVFHTISWASQPYFILLCIISAADTASTQTWCREGCSINRLRPDSATTRSSWSWSVKMRNVALLAAARTVFVPHFSHPGRSSNGSDQLWMEPPSSRKRNCENKWLGRRCATGTHGSDTGRVHKYVHCKQLGVGFLTQFSVTKCGSDITFLYTTPNWWVVTRIQNNDVINRLNL